MPKKEQDISNKGRSCTRRSKKKSHDHKAAYDPKCSREETQSADKNPCKNHEKHILEIRNNKESSGNKLIYILKPPDTHTLKKEQMSGQNDKNLSSLNPATDSS